MPEKRSIRESRLFRDNGRALVVAMDHPRVFDTITGLKNANSVIKKVIDGGADAVLAPFGTASDSSKVLRNAGLWLSVDTTRDTVTTVVEMALRLGADGIKVEIFPWCKTEDDYFSKSTGNETVLNAVCLASECQKWGLPLMIETIPFGWPKADRKTNEQIAAACRIASEAGADYVKSFYTGDKSSFKEVIENCSVPVFILGGEKVSSDLEILKMVRDAMDVGAIGITMGRNIWGHKNIRGMTKALEAIIHNDASVETSHNFINE